MSSEQIGGIVRAVVAAVGGYFVGQGMADQDLVDGIGGGLAVILSAAWSYYLKRNAAPVV